MIKVRAGAWWNISQHAHTSFFFDLFKEMFICKAEWVEQVEIGRNDFSSTDSPQIIAMAETVSGSKDRVLGLHSGFHVCGRNPSTSQVHEQGTATKKEQQGLKLCSNM